MKKGIITATLALMFFVPGVYSTEADDLGPYLIIDDGQLIGQPYRVFHNGPLSGDNFKLQLNFHQKSFVSDSRKPYIELTNPRIIKNKIYRDPRNKDHFLKGTLLIFPFPASKIKEYFNPDNGFLNTTYILNPSFSFSPTLCKMDYSEDPTASDCPLGGAGLINTKNLTLVGNITAAYIWDLFLAIFVVLLLLIVTRTTSMNLTSLIREPNGRLSLSRTQLFFWTMAIGFITFDYALKQFASPKIPINLLLLMGASAVTTGLGQYRKKGQPAIPVPKNKSELMKAKLSHLFIDPQTNEVSLTRFQMFMWTIIALFLFVYKSISSGVLWEVPTELVGLTGISQASYAIPKVMNQTSAEETPEIATGKSGSQTSSSSDNSGGGN